MVSGLEDPSTVRLTLIDFGYADVKCGGTDLTRLAGSPEYAAPEVLSWLAEQGDPYDARCDVWSVGITAHVLVSASPSRRHITRAALRVSDQWVVPAAPPLLPIRRPSLCIDPPTRARPTALHPPLHTPLCASFPPASSLGALRYRESSHSRYQRMRMRMPLQTLPARRPSILSRSERTRT